MANIKFSPYFTDQEEINRIQLQLQEVVDLINRSLTNVENTQFIVVPSSGTSGGGGGGSFTPSQENIYESVKAIIQAGSDVTITADDSGTTLSVSATAGGGGGLTEGEVDARVQALTEDFAENSNNATIPDSKLTALSSSKLTGTIDEARLPSGVAMDSDIPDISGLIADSAVESFAKV